MYSELRWSFLLLMLWNERTVELLGVHVHDIPRAEWQEYFAGVLRGTVPRIAVATPNPEFVVDAVRDTVFRTALARMDVALPDGVGLVYAAAALYGKPLQHRYTGVQALDDVLRMANDIGGQRIALFGGELPEAYLQFAARLRREYPQTEFEFVNPGLIDRYDPRLPEAVREQLRAFAPTVVFVVLTHKKQIPLMLDLLDCVPTLRLTMGIGGAIDMRLFPDRAAPPWFKERGLEWVWRLYKEPWRYKRIANATVVFPLLVAGEALRRRRFMAACKAVWQLRSAPLP